MSLNLTLGEVSVIEVAQSYVCLWRVRGIEHTFFPTKIVAEMAARRHFPQEDADTRYGRISYVRFYPEENL